MGNEHVVCFLHRTVLGMVLLAPILYLDGLGTISGTDDLAFQDQLPMSTPSASKRRVFLGAVIWANSSSEAPSSSA